jgi:hypothetical protein
VPMPRHLSVVVLPLLALAACTATPPANPFAGNTGPLFAPGQFFAYQGQALSAQFADQFRAPTQYPGDPLYFDGSYKGTARLVSATGACPNGRTGVLQVGDDVLTYAYTPDQVFQVPIGSDGTLHGQAGDTTLDGRILNDRLLMTVKSPTCTTQFDTSFAFNHS